MEEITKTTLPVGSIIPKFEMDTQIPGAINPYDAVTYIDASHATCLRYRRHLGSYVITLFREAVHGKINIKATLSTISTEDELMASVYGDRVKKYISSILEELIFTRQGH